VLPYPDYLDDAVHRFHQHLSRLLFGKKPLHVVCTEFDRAMGWQPATAMRAARLLIDRHLLHVDLNRGDLKDLPMEAFSLSSQPVAVNHGGFA
jgi:hypothetical protein